jgi:alpha-ketoglutarate-dependent dioxygenase alkB family protein 2
VPWFPATAQDFLYFFRCGKLVFHIDLGKLNTLAYVYVRIMNNHLPDAVDINQNKLRLLFHPGYLTEERCEETIELLNDIEYEENSQVLVYGKWVDIPRRQTAFGDDGLTYTFSGAEVAAHPWEPFLQDIAEELTEYLRETGILPENHNGINFVLVNYYEDGKSYIGWHADDERDLETINGETIVVSISLGASRDFYFRRKTNHSQKYEMHLGNGDLLIMRGETQKYWHHTLPKRMRLMEPRWNLTFRIMG